MVNHTEIRLPALEAPFARVPPHVQDFAPRLTHIRPFDEHGSAFVDVTLGDFADDHSFNTRDAFRP